MSDNVNHPEHYTAGGIECIEALKAATEGLEGIEAVCTANAIKYLWRWKRKNGAEDLRKAIWYCERLIREIEEQAASAPDQPETCLQRLEREHPDCIDPAQAGGAEGCPWAYGYADVPEWCKHVPSHVYCFKCWHRPVDK